jgi:hypothetical protein
MVAVNRKSFSRFLFLANEVADEHLSHPACGTFLSSIDSSRTAMTSIADRNPARATPET